MTFSPLQALRAAALALPLAGFAARAGAATYYVRPDGGSAAQCTGLADAPYPGEGSGAACAWSHPFVALPPRSNEHPVPARIAGGDTLVIGAGSYKLGYGDDVPEMAACWSGYMTDCHMQPLPPGPDAAHRTRLLGEGWDRGCPAAPTLWGSRGEYALLDLTGSSNVEVACLELTDRDSCIQNHCWLGNCTGGADQIDRCVDNAGDWGRNGILSTDAANVTLHDLDIHGLGEGVHAGRMTDWTVERVRLWANSFAGWDADVSNGGSAPSSNAGTLAFRHIEIAWSGCGERYPGGEIFGCWDQNEGGYGDGFGTARTGGNWIFEDSYVHHNVSDGLDLLYADATATVTMRRVRAEGNAGNQLKASGAALIENSLVIGSCAEPWAAFPPNNADARGYDPSQFRGRYNMELSGACRASGDAIAISLVPGATSTLRQNTVTGQGNCLVIGVNGDAASRLVLSNNLLVGGNEDWLTLATGGGTRLTCGVYVPSAGQAAYDNNLFWAVRNGQCPPGSLCADPRLADPALATFDPTPTPGSPAIDASTYRVPSLDVNGVERPQGGRYDIGAVEYAGDAPPAGRPGPAHRRRAQPQPPPPARPRGAARATAGP